MKSRSLVWIGVAVAVAVVGGIVALSRRPRPGPPAGGEPEVVGKPRSAREIVLHGEVQAAASVTLKSPVAGEVTAVVVGEGNPVAEGQLLLQVSDPAVKERLRRAERELARVRNQAKPPQTDMSRKRLEAGQGELNQVRERQERLERELAEYERNHGDVVNALKFLRQAEENVRRAQAAYLAAKAAVEKAQSAGPAAGEAEVAALSRAQRNLTRAREANQLAGSQMAECRKTADQYPAEVIRLKTLQGAAAEGRDRSARMAARVKKLAAEHDRALTGPRQDAVGGAEAVVAAAGKALEACRVKAPQSGTLVSLKARAGQKVSRGATLAIIEVVGGSRLVFRAGLEDARVIQVGQDATVEPAGGVAFTARVSQVSRQAQEARVHLQPVGSAEFPTPGTALVARVRAVP